MLQATRNKKAEVKVDGVLASILEKSKPEQSLTTKKLSCVHI